MLHLSPLDVCRRSYILLLCYFHQVSDLTLPYRRADLPHPQVYKRLLGAKSGTENTLRHSPNYTNYNRGWKVQNLDPLAFDLPQFWNGTAYLKSETNFWSTDDWPVRSADWVHYTVHLPQLLQQMSDIAGPLKYGPSQIDECYSLTMHCPIVLKFGRRVHYG